jgi:PAS domain S-box-containing protein
VDFAQVFDRSPNAYMVIDSDLRYVEANAAYCAAVGAPREALIGRGLFELFPHDPDDPTNANAQALRASFERVLATGQPDHLAYIPYRVARAPGEAPELRVWSATHTPIVDERGEVAYVLQHTVDVTELRQLREAAGVLGRARHVQEAYAVADAEQRHLRTLFEQAPGFVCVLRGPEHVFELANEAYLRLIGRRDVVGKPVREVLPEAPAQGFLDLLDRVRASGEAFVGRDVRVLIGGEEYFLDFVYQPLPGPDGSVEGIFVQGNDVTAVRRLLEERERLAKMVEQSLGFVVATDPTGKVQFVNEAGRRMIGLGGEPGHLLEYVCAQDRARVRDEVLPAVLRDGRWDGEIDLRHVGTHEAIPVHFHAFAMRNADGQVTGLAAITRDLRGARKRARERAAMIDAIPQQVWTARGDGKLDWVSDRVVAYFGAPREEIVGDGWQAFLHPDDLPRTQERWRLSVATGRVYEIDFRLRRRDGAYRWYLGRAVPLRGDTGEVETWFGTNTDVDDARRARETLEARAEYEQQLIGIVSHDLRNPLNAISIASALLLRRGQLDEQQGKAIARIVSSTERAARLIRDLLDFAQARSGAFPIAPAEANLKELARHALDEVHLAYPERAVEVVHRGEETGRWDADRIAQMAGNLIGNAFQHSPPEAPIRVSTCIDDDRAELVVHNEGPPIPDEARARLFAPFVRGGGAKATSGRSVGLGLYIAQRIVEAHGGTIGVTSAEGEGTTFRVTLPRRVS